MWVKWVLFMNKPIFIDTKQNPVLQNETKRINTVQTQYLGCKRQGEANAKLVR